MRKTGVSPVILLLSLVALLVLAACAAPASAPASAPAPAGSAPKPVAKLPELVTITTLPSGSAKYVVSVGIRTAIEKHSPLKARLESVSTDVARIAPLVIGGAEFAVISATTAFYFSEGKEPGFSDHGAQPVRRVWNGFPFVNAAYTRANAGIKSLTAAELKGKRVPSSAASGGWTYNNVALLSWAGLTWSDVRRVEVSSINAGLAGPLEGTVDITTGTLWSASTQELAASPHGIKWFDFPKSEVEAWKRVNAAVPWWASYSASAAGLPTGQKLAVSGYEQGIWSLPSVPDEVVYEVVKAMHEGYDTYKEMEAELKDWTWDRATTLEGLMKLPYHDGMVKYMKDKKAWTPEHEALQQEALKLEKERVRK